MASAELSVVVPAVNGGEALRATLEALERQRQDVELEVLVVNRLGVEAGRELSREFGRVRLIDVAVDTSIPQMRALAFRAATAPSVAVIEDHVIVPSGWARALLGAQSASTPVVGGPVDNGATGTIVDWAAFLCEYSACMPPFRRALLRGFPETTSSTLGRCWTGIARSWRQADGRIGCMMPCVLMESR